MTARWLKIPFEELRGEKRDDGRFHVKLRDGSEGIWMRQEELDKIEEERQAGIKALHKAFDPKEEDRQTGNEFQILVDKWNREWEAEIRSTYQRAKNTGE